MPRDARLLTPDRVVLPVFWTGARPTTIADVILFEKFPFDLEPNAWESHWFYKPNGKL